MFLLGHATLRGLVEFGETLCSWGLETIVGDWNLVGGSVMELGFPSLFVFLFYFCKLFHVKIFL